MIGIFGVFAGVLFWVFMGHIVLATWKQIQEDEDDRNE